MTATAVVLLVVFVAWLLGAVTTIVMMGRRGYDPWSWGFVGLLYGVFSTPFALLWDRRNRARRTEHEELVVEAGRPSAGSLRVLVGVDGSAESRAALRAVTELLGPRVRTLSIATVIDFDAADAITHSSGAEFREYAEGLLRDAARAVSFASPTTVILVGRPADALTDYAQRHGIDVTAIGARGHGAAKTVLGSVADELVRHPRGRVLVVPADGVRHSGTNDPGRAVSAGAILDATKKDERGEEPVMEGLVGDEIIVEGRHLGDLPRRGEVLEVLETGGVTHYRIRWDDGTECVFFPSSDARFVHVATKK